ncbi:MAG: hypothetical protein KJ065_05660 [Anaerolineae bacterium]|nr:hypothetical protein [Anaerolineae bacterium]
MSDLYERIISQRDALPRLMERIPGFTGYLDLTARRAADRMIRDYVSGEVQKRLTRLADIGKRLLDSEGGLSRMSKLESARSKWQLYHDRVKAAAPGYQGFFELKKVDALALEHLYSFDDAQLRFVDRLDEAVTALDQAVRDQADVGAAIEALEQAAVEANEAFLLRDDVVAQIGQAK